MVGFELGGVRCYRGEIEGRNESDEMRRTYSGKPKTQVSGPYRAADMVLLGADDEIRTRDPHLGKVMLYQLSHIRVVRVAI